MELEIGKKVAALRKAQGVTQAQLAEYLAIQPQTVSRWEAEGGLPDVALLPKLALFFGVSMDELFGMTDLERIDDLVWKYSVLRDEKSFEEVMRSIDLAVGSLEEQLRDGKEDRPELREQRERLLAWKVHVYIQKSRKAQEEAETLLDSLLREAEDPGDPLYLSLRLQKQQFRIQKGEGRAALREAQGAWEESPDLPRLRCYMEALSELDRGEDILRLWQEERVQELAAEVTEDTTPLWQIMFRAAAAEGELAPFQAHMGTFRERADGRAIFEAEWALAELYGTLGMRKEKEESKARLLELLERLTWNEYIKPVYLKKIQEL